MAAVADSSSAAEERRIVEDDAAETVSATRPLRSATALSTSRRTVPRSDLPAAARSVAPAGATRSVPRVELLRTSRSCAASSEAAGSVNCRVVVQSHDPPASRDPRAARQPLDDWAVAGSAASFVVLAAWAVGARAALVARQAVRQVTSRPSRA